MESDEGDLTKLVAQIKTAAAKKVKARKKGLMKEVEAKAEKERQERLSGIDQGLEDTRRFLETDVLPYLQKMGETQKDLITDLEGLEQEFADIQRQWHHAFIKFANESWVGEGKALRDGMRSRTEQAEYIVSAVQETEMVNGQAQVEK